MFRKIVDYAIGSIYVTLLLLLAPIVLLCAYICDKHCISMTNSNSAFERITIWWFKLAMDTLKIFRHMDELVEWLEEMANF